MILDHNHVVIYSFPRAGTKLLANVLTQFGYHNYGEWYDVWASDIVDTTAHRRPYADLARTQVQSLKNYDSLKHSLVEQLVQRRQQWIDTHQALQPVKWSITIWPNNLADFPFLLDQYQHCTWLCATRDPWDQLLSWCVSNLNQNFNGERVSRAVNISHAMFQRWYWQLRQLELHQQWILQNRSSYAVPFDQLIAGTYSDFGKPYTVTSADEHSNIEQLVTNIEQVRSWWHELSGTP